MNRQFRCSMSAPHSGQRASAFGTGAESRKLIISVETDDGSVATIKACNGPGYNAIQCFWYRALASKFQSRSLGTFVR